MKVIEDTQKQHVEAGDECMIRKVKMTPELMNEFASRTIDGYRVYWVWGEPDEDGFYNPYATVDYDDQI